MEVHSRKEEAMRDKCPICDTTEPHEHIFSKALPPGEHSTYEELLAEVERYESKPPTFAELSNLQDDIENFKRWNGELKESIIAILRCASEGGPDEIAAQLGLIRIECNRVLGAPGAQAVMKLSDSMCSTDELMEQLKEYMNKHTYATGTGPSGPPTKVLAPEEE
jgi:hypothetical protein